MIKFKEEIIDNFKKRYPNLHPLVFHRSVERANSLIELFDVLENIPSKFPIVWDEEKRSWIKETDVMLQKQIKNIRKQ